MGLTGPDGKYFCNDCLVTLQDAKKGVPHFPVILAKCQPLTFTEGRSFEIRAMKSISENGKSFKEAGSTNPSNFLNSENVPLFQAAGPVINHTSVAPLHIALGLGLKV